MDEHAMDAELCREDPRGKSLFLGVMGTPYQTDLVTSLLRLTEASLRQGVYVTVWTCGYATMLTQLTLVRPHDPAVRPGDPHPTTAGLVQRLIETYPNQLSWYVCRYCMEERGAVDQIPEVEVKIPFSFNTYMTIADKAVVLGVKS